jgi:hypothetical protein
MSQQMTARAVNGVVHRVLSLALCYVLVIQAFLATFGIAASAPQAPDVAFVICYGNDGADRDQGGTGPKDALLCAVCAHAAVGAAPVPKAIAFVVVWQAARKSPIALVEALALRTMFDPRAGAARAPPQLA